jgi:hypothetical protein
MLTGMKLRALKPAEKSYRLQTSRGSTSPLRGRESSVSGLTNE